MFYSGCPFSDETQKKNITKTQFMNKFNKISSTDNPIYKLINELKTYKNLVHEQI